MKSNAGIETHRLLSRCWLHRMGLTLFVLAGLSFAQPESTTAQKSEIVNPSEVPAGVDYFKTVEEGSYLRFKGEFRIPAGFFEKGSRPFTGVVRLKGVPIRSFREQKTGDADTVVERTEAAKFSGPGARAVVPIRLVALSLESTEPIKIRVGQESQRWRMKLELSPSQNSEGTMTLVRRSEKGGTFSSRLVVYTLFTFKREGDGVERTLDVGKMKFGKGGIETLTVRARAVPWALECSQLSSAGFCAGLNTAGSAVVIGHSAPNHAHRIILPNRDY
jgi:hypothetical protein